MKIKFASFSTSRFLFHISHLTFRISHTFHISYFLMKPWVEQMNRLGKAQIPFLFIIDFEQIQPIVLPLAEVNADEIRYNFHGFKNYSGAPPLIKSVHFSSLPLAFTTYQNAFRYVMQELQAGNAFLVNLTFPTAIRTNLTLLEILHHSQAAYKLWYRDEWVVFSPERFVQIDRGRITTFPMKGTIDATLPEAEARLLADDKERAEHITVVDLLRNDLSQYATGVVVERFRYVEEIRARGKTLLQVSSEVAGTLSPDYPQRIGDIISAMLPAGSVSGAPKPKTLEIIRQAELGPRGYYTGVMGYFDGQRLDSGVMIRFMEKAGDQLYYRSGGGITARSVLEAEYRELHEKVYLPIGR